MSNLGQKLCDLGLYVRLCVDMNVTKIRWIRCYEESGHNYLQAKVMWVNGEYYFGL